ncbi:MAG: hypothetical protein Q9187_003324 [Circinaria calcarea]
MSGFEIVGVILAVYPLIGTALKVYQATKSRRGAASLALAISTEEIIFSEFVQNLLAPNVSSEAELVRLADPSSQNLELWKDTTLQQNLRNRLGPRKAKVVLETLCEIGELLKSLQDELSHKDHGVVRRVDGETKWIFIRYGTADELLRKFRANVREIKQSLPQSSLRDRLDSLTKYNYQLKRLMTDRSSPRNVTSKTVSVPSRRYLRRDSSHVVDLYNVIYNGYQCNCDVPHLANFGLPQISDHSQTDSTCLINDWQFDLLFPIDGSEPDDEHFTSASELDRFMVTWSQLKINRATPGSPKNVAKQQLRSISICECSDARPAEQQGPIQDLCDLIKTLDASVLAANARLGVLRLREKRYELQAPVSQQNAAPPPSMVCLDDLLTDQRFLVSRKERMSLALRLSYAILQFYSTPWIEACWTWRDFCINKHNDSQLFISRRFYSTRSRTSDLSSRRSSLNSGFWDIVGEPILTRLGFALIELALGRRLAELRPEHQGSATDPDALDFRTARKLVDGGYVMREEGQRYEGVVKACLYHQIVSSQATFQEEVERCIIEPLHTMWTSSWGDL